MEPRQIDALIAEKLFGWEWTSDQDIDDHPTGDWYGLPPGAEWAEEVPHYSTTWEGMGLVVEAMEAKGWEWRIVPQEDGDGHRYRMVEFCQSEPPHDFAFTGATKAAELPDRTAKIALIALGVEVS